MDFSEQQHWNKVYGTKAENEVSWFQPYPKTSMAFVTHPSLYLNFMIALRW